MSKPEWQDTSSGRGQKDDKWSVQIADFSVSIHHYLGCGKKWFVTCHSIGLERHELLATTSDQAKKEALPVVLMAMKQRAKDLEKKIKNLDEAINTRNGTT